MPIARKSFQQAVTASNADVYSVGDGRRAVIASCLITNHGASDQTITIHIYPTGGAPGNGNVAVIDKSIPAGSQRPIVDLINQTMGEGDTFSIIGSVASSMNVRLAVAEFY